jgi:methionine-rich copper-binding protein CopC
MPPALANRLRTATTPLFVAVLLVVALPPSPVAAHAILLVSEPAAGATLDAAPSEIRLEFNEAIEADFGQLQVSGPDGRRLDEEPPTADGTIVTSPLAIATQAGTHTVAYRIISADGHPVEGELIYELSELAVGDEGDEGDEPAGPQEPTT